MECIHSILIVSTPNDGVKKIEIQFANRLSIIGSTHQILINHHEMVDRHSWIYCTPFCIG
jgi:hypothetical protein